MSRSDKTICQRPHAPRLLEIHRKLMKMVVICLKHRYLNSPCKIQTPIGRLDEKSVGKKISFPNLSSPRASELLELLTSS